MNTMNEREFLKLGNKFTKSSITKSENVAVRRFISYFGVTPLVCSIAWDKIKSKAPPGSVPEHLLWTLNFLKEYSHESVRHGIFNADEKTIRKWTWIFVKLLSDLDVIIWEKRFESAKAEQTCFVSIDGVDFKIFEPKPFNPEYYSHKFRGPGLRYEVGLNINTGNMVWVHGGYPCGLYSDLVIAREVFIFNLERGEKAMADKGYPDPVFFILPSPQNKVQHGVIMARHETINKRLKQFEVLNQRFRHELSKHPMVFHAVAHLTQLMIQNGQPLFSV